MTHPYAVMPANYLRDGVWIKYCTSEVEALSEAKRHAELGLRCYVARITAEVQPASTVKEIA